MEVEQAFVELVQARSSALLRLAYLLTGESARAEDLLQESLLSVYRSRHRLRDVGALEGYVRTTMARTSATWWRRSSSRELVLADAGDRLTTEPPPDLHAGPLWRAIQQLPGQQRAVVVLAYYEDLGEAEIAEALGCSVGAVKSHRARALKALRTTSGTEDET